MQGPFAFCWQFYFDEQIVNTVLRRACEIDEATWLAFTPEMGIKIP